MIIKKFMTQGGHHCITNSLKQMFAFYDYPISEHMLEKNISERLGIGIKMKKPKDSKVAFDKLKKSIYNQKPVMLYVDLPFLNYLNMQDSGHFGGHSIIVFGFDDHEKYFYVSDRDSSDWKIHSPKGEIGADYHKVPFDELKKARNSSFQPFPANNKWVDFDFTSSKVISKNEIFKAIRINIDNMLNAPANLLGINGIQKFAKEIIKWKNFDIEKKKLAGITNYFMVSSKGGTGGGAFRKLYGKFLIEASDIVKTDLEQCGNEFLSISEMWDSIAVELMELYDTGKNSILEKLSFMIIEIAEKKKKGLEQLKYFIQKS